MTELITLLLLLKRLKNFDGNKQILFFQISRKTIYTFTLHNHAFKIETEIFEQTICVVIFIFHERHADT